MSAAARLWGRAPLWRFSVVSAVTATVLALLFPWTPWPPPNPTTTTYQPFGPADVLRPPLREVLTVLGRQVPLPPGDWHPLINLVGRGQPSLDSFMLVRMSGSRPSGFTIVQGTAANPTGPPITQHYRCDDPRDVVAEILPVRPGVTLECWNMRLRTLPQEWNAPSAAPIYQDTLARLREGGIPLSGSFIVANWFLADQSGILLVDYFFPVGRTATGAPQPPDLGGMETWAQGWTSLLESGANGILQASDVEQVSARLKGK